MSVEMLFTNRSAAEKGLFPPEAGWFGVEYEKAPNFALVIKDPTATNFTEAFKLSRPGLACRVSPIAAKWPDCALSTPPTCERTCDAPFNHTGFPVYLTATAREAKNWTFYKPGGLEAEPPPQSPVACGATGACGPQMDVMLVPHGATDVRVGALPWTTV